MQRITITLDDELMADLDRLIKAKGYQNRSEAIRDLARTGLKEANAWDGRMTDCIAALVYVYDHNARQLSKRLTHNFHDHSDLSMATMHMHLDHDTCMEVAVLRGGSEDVRHLADHVIAERGVRHGRLVAIPLDDTRSSAHPHSHEHAHVKGKPKAKS